MVRRTALITFFSVGVVACGFTSPDVNEEDLPEVYFATTQSITDESVGTAEVLLQLSEPSDQTVTVEFSITGGTATVGNDGNNGDVRITEGKVTFPPQTDHALLKVTIVDDGIEELEEDAEITLKAPKGAVLGEDIKHDLKISSSKLPRVRFGTLASSAGEETGAQSFVIELDRASSTDVVVAYRTNGTVEPGDHGVIDGKLTIPAGRASAMLPVPIVNDPTDEDNETLALTLIPEVGAIAAPNQYMRIHTIVDDDLPPGIAFTSTSSSASEASTTKTIEVKLALASEKPITINYATAGGNAGTADFSLTAGTLTFPPGTTTQEISVTIVNDEIDELDETVAIALSGATNATLLPGALPHLLTITDDDSPPTLSFQQGASTASEGTATHPITVELSAPSALAVQFSLARTGTSTVADLVVPAGPFTIPAGSTSLTINLTVTDDALDDDDETAILSLTGLSNASPGATPAHTVTITDNDDPPPP